MPPPTGGIPALTQTASIAVVGGGFEPAARTPSGAQQTL
jgi:hypothetical protein